MTDHYAGMNRVQLTAAYNDTIKLMEPGFPGGISGSPENQELIQQLLAINTARAKLDNPSFDPHARDRTTRGLTPGQAYEIRLRALKEQRHRAEKRLGDLEVDLNFTFSGEEGAEKAIAIRAKRDQARADLETLDQQILAEQTTGPTPDNLSVPGIEAAHPQQSPVIAAPASSSTLDPMADLKAHGATEGQLQHAHQAAGVSPDAAA